MAGGGSRGSLLTFCVLRGLHPHMVMQRWCCKVESEGFFWTLDAPSQLGGRQPSPLSFPLACLSASLLQPSREIEQKSQHADLRDFRRASELAPFQAFKGSSGAWACAEAALGGQLRPMLAILGRGGPGPPCLAKVP